MNISFSCSSLFQCNLRRKTDIMCSEHPVEKYDLVNTSFKRYPTSVVSVGCAWPGSIPHAPDQIDRDFLSCRRKKYDPVHFENLIIFCVLVFQSLRNISERCKLKQFNRKHPLLGGEGGCFSASSVSVQVTFESPALEHFDHSAIPSSMQMNKISYFTQFCLYFCLYLKMVWRSMLLNVKVK